MEVCRGKLATGGKRASEHKISHGQCRWDVWFLLPLFPSECFWFQVSKAACILTTQTLMRLLKSREAAAAVDVKTWPTIIDTGGLVG